MAITIESYEKSPLGDNFLTSATVLGVNSTAQILSASGLGISYVDSVQITMSGSPALVGATSAFVLDKNWGQIVIQTSSGTNARGFLQIIGR